LEALMLAATQENKAAKDCSFRADAVKLLMQKLYLLFY
jgi:hypothetical protein